MAESDAKEFADIQQKKADNESPKDTRFKFRKDDSQSDQKKIAKNSLDDYNSLIANNLKLAEKFKKEVFFKYAANEKTVLSLLTKAKDPKATEDEKKLVTPLTALETDTKSRADNAKKEYDDASVNTKKAVDAATDKLCANKPEEDTEKESKSKTEQKPAEEPNKVFMMFKKIAI